MAQQGGDGWVIEDGDDGRRLVVTGRWTPEAAAAVASGDVDELWLNYARGFAEPDLDFIQDWPLLRLLVIARTIEDVSPVERLSSLESLSIEPSRHAQLDLSRLPRLRDLFAFARLVEESLADARNLERLALYQSRAETVAAIALPNTLRELELTDSSRLTTLAGVERLDRLERLKVALAPQLREVRSVAALAGTLSILELETCRKLSSLAGVESLAKLRHLEFGDCGAIPTLAPLRPLHELQGVYAWGDTRIEDGDLSPLAELPRLAELRMRDRGEYRPHVRDLVDENLQRKR
ncbi:MAG: hypothetical protein QOJ29_3835 [Thermoleophilaceae bacterium]|nr:hypothetical protein [Thermoleophilaceae bacterium]